jgi:hypothetical protein
MKWRGWRGQLKRPIPHHDIADTAFCAVQAAATDSQLWRRAAELKTTGLRGCPDPQIAAQTGGYLRIAEFAAWEGRQDIVSECELALRHLGYYLPTLTELERMADILLTLWTDEDATVLIAALRVLVEPDLVVRRQTLDLANAPPVRPPLLLLTNVEPIGPPIATANRAPYSRGRTAA